MELFKELGEICKPELIKASTVVMSHLSNANELVLIDKPIDANIKINFAKYIILKCNGDLTKVINANELYRLGICVVRLTTNFKN
ncbi:MAG: hypothetical protein R6U15_01720 [Candidatus Izemoplasmatales bacterium]